MQQAVCVRRKKKSTKKTRKNPVAPKTHHEIHSSPATTTTSRRHATKHVPRVSPYLPASIDPGFVEIGLVQVFSQSVKTTNVTIHTLTGTQTDRRTDRQTNQIMASCTQPGMKRLFCLKAKKRPRSLRSLGLASLKYFTLNPNPNQRPLLRCCSWKDSTMVGRCAVT